MHDHAGRDEQGDLPQGEDLPQDPTLRDRIILAIFGSPDLRQIDGLGGADSLTSKLAIISPCERAGSGCQLYVWCGWN